MSTKKSIGKQITHAISKVSSNLLAAGAAAFEEGPGTGLARMRRILHDEEAGPFFQRVYREWTDLVEKGKAKAERIGEPSVRTALAELAHDLEKEVPDPRRLDLLRRAFLAVAIGDPSDPDETIGLAFLQTARRLSGLQAKVLAVGYHLRHVATKHLADGDRIEKWTRRVMAHTGMRFRPVLQRELLHLNREMLVNTNIEGAALAMGPEAGVFTDYGHAFCEFLERAEPFEEAPKEHPTGHMSTD